MNKKILVSIKLPTEVLEFVDECAKQELRSRSNFIEVYLVRLVKEHEKTNVRYISIDD